MASSQTPGSEKISVAVAPVKKEEAPRYYYSYGRERDPFEPLLTAAGSPSSNRAARDTQTIAQNFSSLELKGIIKDREGKLAIIVSREGESFTLKAGRIYDKRNQKMTGMTGVIKEKSVVLVGSNKATRELFLKREEK